jgi:hypothetical protein
MEFLSQYQLIIGTKEGSVFIYDFKKMQIQQKYEFAFNQIISEIVLINSKQFALLLNDSTLMTIDIDH